MSEQLMAKVLVEKIIIHIEGLRTGVKKNGVKGMKNAFFRPLAMK